MRLVTGLAVLAPRFALAPGFALAAGFALASLQARADDLTVVGFGGSLQDAMRSAYFTPYRQAGHALKEDTTNGGLAKIKAMVTSGAVEWDVVQMPRDEMELACQEGLLEPLSAEELGLEGLLIPAATEPECGIGFFVWSKVLAYDPARLPAAPTSWADFFDSDRFPGKRGLRKNARMTLEIALMADGVPPDEVYRVLGTEEGVQRAFDKLDGIRDRVVWWESGAQAPEWLASGEVAMSSAYNGRIANANEEGRAFGMVWDGQIFAMEFWTVPRGADLAAAKDFIAFAMAADRQKAFTDAIPYGVTNLEANALIDPAVASQLPTTPENMRSVLPLGAEFWVEHRDELQARFTRWLAQ